MKTQKKTKAPARPATRSNIANLRCSPALFAVIAALAGWKGAR